MKSSRHKGQEMKPKPAPRKLTPDQIREIRESVRLRDELKARASRMSNSAIADRLGVHVRTIEQIVGGYTYAWVD